MGDEDDGFFHGALQGDEFVLQFGADERVERGKRLVHEQDIGVGDEGAGEADALLHAAGELLGVFFRPGEKADDFQPLVDLFFHFGSGHFAEFKPQLYIAAHRAPGQ